MRVRVLVYECVGMNSKSSHRIPWPSKTEQCCYPYRYYANNNYKQVVYARARHGRASIQPTIKNNNGVFNFYTII